MFTNSQNEFDKLVINLKTSLIDYLGRKPDNNSCKSAFRYKNLCRRQDKYNK
jgi:hypothetical protein